MKEKSLAPDHLLDIKSFYFKEKISNHFTKRIINFSFQKFENEEMKKWPKLKINFELNFAK